MLLAAVDSPGRPRAGLTLARESRCAPLPFYVETVARGGAASRQACELARFQDCGPLSPGNDTLTGRKTTLGYYIMFAAAVTGCLWLAQVDLVEMRTDIALELVESRALKDLDHEIAAGLQVRSRKIQCDLGKPDAARLVHDIDAGQIGRHVADHKVDRCTPHGRLD